MRRQVATVKVLRDEIVNNNIFHSGVVHRCISYSVSCVTNKMLDQKTKSDRTFILIIFLRCYPLI